MSGSMQVAARDVAQAGARDVPQAQAGARAVQAWTGEDEAHGRDSQVQVPALAVEDLSFSYPGADEPLLRDVSFEVAQGAFVLLVGETGSGKSTLLSLLKPQAAPAGLRSGSITVFGKDAFALGDATSARTIGLVAQNPATNIVSDTVWHEMAFGLENLGVEQSAMRRRVAETAHFFGIGEWFGQKTDALSGGRKQLLALAATLALRPRVLLLDEPTAQLDPVAEKNFLHALFRVNRELGCTVLVATHTPQAMIEYATGAFSLKDGALQQVEDLESLRTRVPLFEEGALQEGASQGARPRASVSQSSSHKWNTQRDAVKFKDAWFRYGRDAEWVLRGLDLQIAAGTIHALVGGNGSGKSTLLALMAGTRKLQHGKAEIRPEAKAFLPQDPQALFAEETVEAELMEWAKLGGYTSADIDDMLERIGLARSASLHPYDLSGGQQQLLALGKLLLIKPRLLLLDEPTKGLDNAARSLTARALVALREDGATMVLATHDLDFVSQVANEVSMLFDGEVACTEPTAEFFRGNMLYRP